MHDDVMFLMIFQVLCITEISTNCKRCNHTKHIGIFYVVMLLLKILLILFQMAKLLNVCVSYLDASCQRLRTKPKSSIREA